MTDNRSVAPSDVCTLRERMFIYTLGTVFIVLLMVFYIKADVFLAWMENLVRAWFL